MFDTPLTRRRLVGGAAASALAGAGVYELIDRLAAPPARAAGAALTRRSSTCSRTCGSSRATASSFAPPLHQPGPDGQARGRRVSVGAGGRPRASSSTGSRRSTAATPPPRRARRDGGLGSALLPALRPRQAARYLPLDRRASAAAGRPVARGRGRHALPERPRRLVLERNDVAVLLRSDSLEHIREGARRSSRRRPVPLTSIRTRLRRRGLRRAARASPSGSRSQPACPAPSDPGRRGALPRFHLDPEAGPGRARIANLETLGYGGRPDDYFEHGTHMHVSHVFEDLEAWYRDSGERLASAFRPGVRVPPGTLTVHPGTGRDVQTAAQVVRDYASTADRPQRVDPDRLTPRTTSSAPTGRLRAGNGRSPSSRLQHPRQPVRVDRRPGRDHASRARRRGSISSCSTRRATTSAAGAWRWTGCSRAAEAGVRRRSRGQGFNSVLKTTHRQNFLVPPRPHRSFPLVRAPDLTPERPEGPSTLARSDRPGSARRPGPPSAAGVLPMGGRVRIAACAGVAIRVWAVPLGARGAELRRGRRRPDGAPLPRTAS